MRTIVVEPVVQRVTVVAMVMVDLCPVSGVVGTNATCSKKHRPISPPWTSMENSIFSLNG